MTDVAAMLDAYPGERPRLEADTLVICIQLPGWPRPAAERPRRQPADDNGKPCAAAHQIDGVEGDFVRLSVTDTGLLREQ